MTVDEFFEKYPQNEVILYICKIIENQLISDTSFRLKVLSRFIHRNILYHLRENKNIYSDLINSSQLKSKIEGLLIDRNYEYVLSFLKNEGLDEDVNLIFDIIDELDNDLLIKSIILTINDYLTDNKEEVLNYVKKMKILQGPLYIEEINDINDKIGDSLKILKYPDFDNRDSAFVDIDGEVLISNKGQTHGQLIQEWLDTFDKKLENGWYRPEDNEIKELINAKYTAFGHIINDCIIIEEATLNDTSIEQVISDIKENDIDYNKIYDLFGREITRVAKIL